VAGTPPNGELFASPASQREGLARLVERLQARLGADRVQRFGPVADHRPECATRWQTVDPARLGTLGTPGTGPATSGPADTAEQARALATQPLWLLSPPRPLAEQQQRPLLAGQPLQLLAGPDRLETGWWDDTGPAVRDYFIAQAASGALVWVYRHRLPADGAGPGWFLQGLFG
jgi:protein ImuB